MQWPKRPNVDSPELIKEFGPSCQTQDLLFFRVRRDLLPAVRQWQDVLKRSMAVTDTVKELHCSVIYPVLDVHRYASEVEAAVAAQPAFNVQFGCLKVFRNTDSDIVVIEILSIGLDRMNDQVQQRDLEMTRDSLLGRVRTGISVHVRYSPHVTLVYCRPGTVPRSVEGMACAGADRRDMARHRNGAD